MRCLVLMSFALMTATSLRAATLTVDDDGPADYNNIRAAIHAARSGDTILASDGVYRGPNNRNLNLESKLLVITSRNGPGQCIIDCEYKDSGFYLAGKSVSGSVIEGLTVCNGWDLEGAGICCNDQTSVTIRNCIIRDNNTSFNGAGVLCDGYSTTTLIDCIIYGNISERNGGGIHCHYSNLTLTGCVVARNLAGFGGGLSFEGSTPQISGCTFLQNTARIDGGGIYGPGVPQPLVNNVFLGNQAGQAGGGLWLWLISSGKDAAAIVNCTFSGNTAGTIGGGLHCYSGTSLRLANCILTDHVGHAIAVDWGTSPTTQGCLFHNNQPGDCYTSAEKTVTGANQIDKLRTDNRGNQTGDPRFAVPGDVRPTLVSPAIDRGVDGTGIELPETDIDGNPRVLDGNHDGLAAVDIGACECDPQIPSSAVSTHLVEFIRDPNGSDPQPVVLTIGRGGDDAVNWRIDCNCPWLRIEPSSGAVEDAPSQVTLTANVGNLARGTYQAILEVRDPDAVTSPRRVLVVLRVRGILAVPEQYSSIQGAINATMKNEIVEVGAGTYQESLILRKPVHLRGVNRPTLVVPPSTTGIRTGIEIDASGCTVDGFEILDGLTGISVGSSNNLITNNRVQGCDWGISVNEDSNTLLNNEVANCSVRGMSIFGAANVLKGNCMHDNSCNFGVASTARNTDNPINDIDRTNTVDGKPIYYLVGQSNVTIGADVAAGCVVAIHCRGLKIVGQTFRRNEYGIRLTLTTDSQIVDCNLTDNAEAGVYLDSSSRNTLTGNTMTGGKYGLYLYGSENTVLRRNRMADNRYNFYCMGSSSSSANWHQDITPDNTVDGKPIYYLVGAKDTVIDSSTDAGCVYAVECSGITVRDLVFENNGMGLALVLTHDSTIENVTAVNNDFSGILLYACSNDVVCRSLTSGNRYGMTIRADTFLIKDLQAITLDQNTISSNQAGIYAGSQALDIRNCYMAANSTCGLDYYGDGLRIANSTFFGNGGDTSSGLASGGITVSTSDGATIVNSIFWGNTPWQISQYGALAVTHSDVQGGYAGEGNFSLYPAITPDGHLTQNSPCLAAGAGGDCPPYDVDGEPRDPNGPVDVGCDQFRDGDGDGLPDWWELAYFGDATAATADDDPDEDGHDNLAEYELYSSDPTTPATVYYVDANQPDDSDDGLSWKTAKRSVQAAIDVASDSDVIRVAPGEYPGNVTPAGRVILVTGLDPEDPNVIAATVLAGTLTMNAGELRGCVIRGLTLSNPRNEGLHCVGVCPTIRRCRITGNRYTDWQHGGGVTLIGGAPLIEQCLISGNLGYSKGAGVYCSGSAPVLRNCILAGNTIGREGTALYGEQSDMAIENCTFADNGRVSTGTSPQGSAVQCLKSTMRITDSILWNPSTVQVLGSESSVTVMYSDVKGGPEALQGVSRTIGNISVDPQFVDPGYWDSVPTTNFWENTARWIEGDYHLKSSGRRWSQSATQGSHWVSDDVTSRCIDAGNPAAGIGEEPVSADGFKGGRDENPRIDMGAYGGTREASLAPNGWAILTDINNDGRVDWRDFSRWAAAFRSRVRLDPANVTRDSQVDYADLSRMADQWLQSTDWPR